ncbi:PREDICTED: uncharacterized protein LOC104750926 [Camelina sativa]|uniref:Uncharacterized protein LOC104750926 n=1 Tax=Camelina sativa TaxID=90675 RepID=A0ABM0WHB7_CAMSA|nr:PREDICTED: uncharacterized protein LOC104750926 [Camelina sativa]
MTHDSKVCPEVLKLGTGHGSEELSDKRGGQRQLPLVKQEVHHKVGGWEKPWKHARRALDFQSAEAGEYGYFPQLRHGDSGLHGPRQQERFHGQIWGQQRSFGETAAREEGSRRGFHSGGGESSSKAPGFHLKRKGAGLAWPKPLYMVKQAPMEKHSQPSLENNMEISRTGDAVAVRDQAGYSQKGDGVAAMAMDFVVKTDDLLEDGEFNDNAKGDLKIVQEEGNFQEEGIELHTGQGTDLQTDQESDIPSDSDGGQQGDGNKQKTLGKQEHFTMGGKPSDGGRLGKKGMGALPKPPVRT